VYQDGLKTEREYERELTALRAQLDTATNDVVARFDVGRAIELVNDLPDLFASATAAERRAVLGSVIEKIWVADRELHAVTPRAEWYPLMASIARCVHGVADGPRPRNQHIGSYLPADPDGAPAAMAMRGVQALMTASTGRGIGCAWAVLAPASMHGRVRGGGSRPSPVQGVQLCKTSC
jgi:hypothetical protein